VIVTRGKGKRNSDVAKAVDGSREGGGDQIFLPVIKE
jgi:hypothetical protein